MDTGALDRLFWWQDQGPKTPLRIAAQVMALGSLEDIQRVREAHGDSIFAEVLANPPQGLFDAKTWSFWHQKVGISPIPPLPSQSVAWNH